MAFTILPPHYHVHRHEAVAIAIAAIGVGMAIGTWVIGPLVTRGSAERPAAVSEHTDFNAMVARPDPFPYRTPTPELDTSGATNYAATAKEKALAELGGQPSGDDGWQNSEPDDARQNPEPRSRWRTHGRYRVPDRFAPQ